MHYTNRQWFGLYFGPIIALLFYFIPDFTGLSNEPRAVLSVTLLVATWWITEPIPMAATSLLPLLLLPLSGGTSHEVASTAYFSPIIFMFLGGFTIALAIEKWNLHKRMAMTILLTIGTSTKRILLGILIATAFLSMWISNAATALMMFPVAIALITEVKEQQLFDSNSLHSFSKGLLLTVAYSASIGGLATLIGSVPNAILAGISNTVLHQPISFVSWLVFAFPVTVLLLILLYFLILFQFPVSSDVKIPEKVVRKQLAALGKVTQEEKAILLIFSATVSLWIFGSLLPIQLTDTTIALLGALALFLIPTHSGKGMLMNWSDMKHLPWGILLLFGGGLSLAAAFVETNLTGWIGMHLTQIGNLPYGLLLLAFATSLLFMTEFLSNTAVANMFIPISIGIATGIGVEPYALMAIVALASTCAFMLPVSTPPNAVIFGSNYISIQDMIRTGVRLNVIAILVIVAAVYFWLPFFL
ncbi:DASS family sodium-coupled anion symporter [Alkalihalobacillus sp. MEB130]|uniref:SLC13 family permease n=1 Tax=Alkalihalobacillus sp. MEB130 TaxID=2976704 RepID=UPI0028E05866|nr:DASS family sodium-coupled anion symporter [Alkalihalobacillus sp. MEB130]MDT8861196.1 DASS family sodium-coupled anion symporter [Alkalihalobacillus sp. MEB130]